MKKIISLILCAAISVGLCSPVSALCNKNKLFRIVVPQDWEMCSGDSRSVEAVFDASITDRRLEWTAEPSDVASVDKWGRVTALKEGTATITAKGTQGISSAAVLTVKDEPTKLEKSPKEKYNYGGAAKEENEVLQKTVTRYAKGDKFVPSDVADESLYPSAQKVTTPDGAVWEITSYGVLRTDKNAKNKRDRIQRFMGDRYFYSLDSENVRAIFSDGTTGIWTVMDKGYTHIELTDISGKDKAVMMSDKTQECVSRHGLTSSAYLSGGKWHPAESDNDGLWTSMYGAGELMRYAVIRDDPNSTPEEIAAAKKTATLSAEAVLMISNISMRTGTTQAYVRAQKNGDATHLDIGKFYTSEALLKGGDYSQNVPGESPADCFKAMNTKYLLLGKRSYFMDKSNLAIFNPEDWADPSVYPEKEYEKRTRLLEGFWARTYFLKQEGNGYWGNIYWSVNGDGTATGKSTIPPTDNEYLLNGENLRGKVTDASGEIPARLWNDIIGSGYDISDVVYKGDTSTDEIIGHLFIYKLAYDILGDEDPELKEIITNTVAKFAQHLADNNYCLMEATGQPTTWGKFNRNYMHNGQNVGGAHLQAEVLLTVFKLAAYVTGDKKWEDEYQMAAFDPAYEYIEVMKQAWDRYKMTMLEYAATGVSPVLAFFLRPFANTKTFKTLYRMGLNYSDEEMAMLGFYLLFQLEDDEKILDQYRDSLDQWWYSISFSENPLWYYIYQLAYPNKAKKDYYGNNLLETASWSLSRHPIDMRVYSASNSNRDDARELDMKDCGIDGMRILSYNPSKSKILFSQNENEIVRIVGIVLSCAHLKWTVAAPDEKAVHKFNHPTYILDDDYNPSEMEASTSYTLPYWMGRYHGMLK